MSTDRTHPALAPGGVAGPVAAPPPRSGRTDRADMDVLTGQRLKGHLPMIPQRGRMRRVVGHGLVAGVTNCVEFTASQVLEAVMSKWIGLPPARSCSRSRLRLC